MDRRQEFTYDSRIKLTVGVFYTASIVDKVDKLEVQILCI